MNWPAKTYGLKSKKKVTDKILMENEINQIMNALENEQIQVVHQYLRDKWKQDVSLFIKTISMMRERNADLSDKLFNSKDFVLQFSRRS